MPPGAHIVFSGIQLVLAGIGIGLLVAAPIGPVNVLCIQRAVTNGFWGGVAAGAGAMLGDGKNATYVWPYFAESDLTKLTPAQEVELYRIVPVVEALAMRKSGKYSYYRAAIGSDGVWHYFMK